mmetsp:Transcript_24038/g.66854  ORF Transcript_24038/g.66854 Transcript_24038/m.66854 type:complete len:501 (-) Transcript_24038:108-1610(-)
MLKEMAANEHIQGGTSATSTTCTDGSDPSREEATQGEAKMAQPNESAGAGGGPNSSLSADANTFVPNRFMKGETMIAQLPPSHRRMLRNFYQMPQTGAWYPYYFGRLKSFSNTNGYGFIECSEAFQDWGSDVFVHKNLVPCPWHIGRMVEFAVTVSSRGQPQAIDVYWLPVVQEPRAPMSLAFAPIAAHPVAGKPLAPAAATQLKAPSDAGITLVDLQGALPASELRHLGSIKSYSAAQGYGFIQCEAVRQKYSRDVYFDKMQLGANGWRIGQTVEFIIHHNAKGHPQARNIQWAPVPVFPTRVATDPMDPLATGGHSTVARAYASRTVEKLQQLLVSLSEKDIEAALTRAIEQQGETGDPDVDYVTFVLDRIADTPSSAGKQITDFVKMLLLLMLAKMFKKPFSQSRCLSMASWFEELANQIEPSSVTEHYESVVEKINAIIQQGQGENPSAFQDETFAKKINETLAQLQSKATICERARSSAPAPKRKPPPVPTTPVE